MRVVSNHFARHETNIEALIDKSLSELIDKILNEN